MDSSNKPDNRIANGILFILLAVFTAVMICLHFVRINFNTFWVDTAFSVDLIRLPFMRMLEATSVNEHPPFYYIFGKAVMLILGDHPYAFRASAFIPYVLILVLTLTYVRKNFGYAPAFLIAGFSSFTPASIVYVLETRMYELGCFLTLASFLSLHLILTKKKGKRIIYWLLFFALSIMTAYTHYYLTVAVCIMYLCLIVYCIKEKYELKECFIFSVLAILSYLPWLGIMLRNFGVRADDWWAGGYSHFDETMREIFGLKRYYILALVFIVFAIVKAFTSRKKDFGRFWFILTGILMIFVTFGVGALVSELVRPLFLSRFIYPFAGVGWLLFGIGIEDAIACIKPAEKLKNVLSAAFSFAIALLLVFGCFGLYRENVAVQKEASALTNAFLEGVSIPAGSTVYSDMEEEEFTIAGCYFPDTTVYIENAMFYYSVPEEESFYLVWKDYQVGEAMQNLNSYGYDVTCIASDGNLGMQGGVWVLFCRKY
ncbi:MAG: glycosyltransferase family 39 protein [Lachnospiraceae bacterium]|nr:glycosyltransferase family 39 protein [Lachnospiraceae bacterium]